MLQARPDRRSFLTALGLGSLAPLWSNSFCAPLPESAAGATAARDVFTADYLFDPGLIYVQTGSLGPCPRHVVEATLEAWYQLESNPTPMAYGDGATLAAAEAVRDRAAAFLGCARDEIVITHSTTDGMNAVAQGMNLSPGDRILTSDQEHEGGKLGWQHVAGRLGVHIDVVQIPPGEHDAGNIVDRFASSIRPETRVISVSHVLMTTGLRMPIAEISALARSRGVLCVVDGAQAAGGIDVDVKALGCHAYATSGHKWILGPKGTGLLYLSSELGSTIAPIQLHDGRTFYSGSAGVGNLPGVVGLGVALDSLQKTGMDRIERHNLGLRDRFHEGLMRIPAASVVSAAPGPLTSPLVTFELPDRHDSGEFRNRLLEDHRMVVKAVPKQQMNGIRFSTHVFNTEDEVDTVLEVVRTELS